ncbi:ribonuclease R [Marmoricola endophyticus]|uniref:Ribonuclease R n=1 Tax=Marmoricola endophyticus TaxID=2040280 RepID=A0A917EYE9_9ACTN|nr:RNB domain-containing ribonuclease [Marmoricola endophyticus]GGF30667.1 ribonuclease R [Marmoricola endophyticus]
MPVRVLRGAEAAGLEESITSIQAELDLHEEFPADVEAAARAAAAEPRLPTTDLTDLPFVTIDPASSTDLDQAMHLVRDGSGYLVHYAIADVAAFVAPGDPVDLEAHRRGQSMYGADRMVPLHPPVLSAGAASLLPDQVCPAFVWTIRLDGDGALGEASVERALVRSRAKLAYDAVQADVSAGRAEPMMALLGEIGRLRLEQETARGGVSLPLPEQEVVVEDGRMRLELRAGSEVESWNAQISLLTGIAAARMMLEAKVGVVRTLPPAPPQALEKLRRTARALGVDWPADLDYPAFVRTLDPTRPADAAMAVACTTLFRGAGYAAFDGDLPEVTEHAALATPYAHVTAPLRRLVDRYALETCAALCAGTAVPDWVRTALPALPEEMRDSGRRAGQYERAVVDLVEATVLADRVGEQLAGVVLEADEDRPTRGEIQLGDPAVQARLTSERPLPVGEQVRATLTTADPTTRKVELTL